VKNINGEDVTQEFIRGAEETLRIARLFNIKELIGKARSPSCGYGQIYDGTFSDKCIAGNGVTTALLKRNGIEVISEEDSRRLMAGEEVKRMIEVKVVDQVLLYQYQSFWSAKKFLEISKDDLKAGFEEKYDVDAREFESSFEPVSHSTITKCYIYGTITKSRSRYTADLLWLLRPYALDFINDNFKESKTGLCWEGTINGILISIKVECPPQDCVYEAWQDPIGHCHGHIWWPASP
jgi:hypothetical protein